MKNKITQKQATELVIKISEALGLPIPCGEEMNLLVEHLLREEPEDGIPDHLKIKFTYL